MTINRKDQINELEKNLLFATEMMKRAKKNMDKLQLAYKKASANDVETAAEGAAELAVTLLELEDQIETMNKALTVAGKTTSDLESIYSGYADEEDFDE